MQPRRPSRSFRNSVPARLALFALLFAAAVGGVHVLALDRLLQVREASSDVRNRWLDSISVLYNVGRHLSDLRASEADVVFIPDPTHRERQATELPILTDQVEKAIERYKLLPHGPEEDLVFNALLQNWAEHAGHARQLALLTQKGQGDAAVALYEGAARSSFQAVRDRNRRLVDLSTAKAQCARNLTAQAFTDAERWISGLILGAGILFAALVVYLWWSVSRPLFELEGLMRRLAAQDTNFTIRFEGRRDEIGEVARALGPVGNHREAMTAAARWIMAAKL